MPKLQWRFQDFRTTEQGVLSCNYLTIILEKLVMKIEEISDKEPT